MVDQVMKRIPQRQSAEGKPDDFRGMPLLTSFKTVEYPRKYQSQDVHFVQHLHQSHFGLLLSFETYEQDKLIANHALLTSAQPQFGS